MALDELGFSTIWPVNKVDTMCEIIYRVYLGYIWLFNINLSRHYVLDI